VTQNGANLTGTANDNGAATTVQFEYGATAAYGSTISANSLAPSSGNTVVAANVAGLSCSTTYHYRLIAKNSVGTATGLDQTFTTNICPAAPSVTPGTVRDVTINNARLISSVNDNGAVTTVKFEYGATTSYGNTVAAGTVPLGAGATLMAVNLSGLNCGSTYHFRITAVNSVGETASQDQSFSTSLCSVNSSVVSGDGYGNGSISPSGLNYFSFGQSPTYRIYPDYWSKIKDVVVDGVSIGAVSSYTVSNVRTNDRTVVAYFEAVPYRSLTRMIYGNTPPNDATVSGIVTSKDVDATARFYYGTTTDYGNSVSAGTVTNGSIKTNVSANLTGLTCGTTYHYQLFVTSSLGTISDGDYTFTTASCPPIQIFPSFTTSSFVLNRATRIFSGTMTVNNITQATITGTLRTYFTKLPTGVTLANPSGTDNTGVYIDKTLTTPLNPGQSINIPLQFNNPAGLKVSFNPVFYQK
jgi:hypothetical protein